MIAGIGNSFADILSRVIAGIDAGPLIFYAFLL
jgi:hypothetical protein